MKKIIGIFKSEDLAVKAIEGLRSSGYEDEEISIITKNEEKYNALTNKVGKDISNEKNVAGGAAAGAVTGGTIGGLGGLLLGLGALAIPGVGPIVAAGPIAAAITGVLAGGTVGGLAGALIDYGIPEAEAKEYEDSINAGDILIFVDDDEDKRDKTYENFYKNESLNRDTYSHRDRTEPYNDNKQSAEKMDKKKDLDQILDEEINNDKDSPASDGEISSHDKGSNKKIDKDRETGNTNPIDNNEKRIEEEKDRYKVDKPFVLDKNLNDGNKF